MVALAVTLGLSPKAAEAQKARHHTSSVPEMVTTELQPGWNLAGWTGDEVDASDLFRTIPGLQAVHAWNAEKGRFLSAVAGAPYEANSLRTLTPGMGLWLFLEGEEPHAWTRPLVPQSGLADLRPGWNLVTWAGPDGVAREEALADIRDILEAHEGPGALSRGDAFWLRTSSAKQWWQLTAPPHIDFRGVFTAERKRELRAYVDDVVAFFVRRHGVAVPGLTVQFGDAASEVWCGGYGGRTIGIRELCITALPHEYAHAVQEYLAVRDTDGNWGAVRGEERLGPAWLSEGAANHAAAVYEDLNGIGSISQWNAEALDIGLANGNSLEAIEKDMGVGGDPGANYPLASLAVSWIVENHGEAALYDYYDVRNEVFRWQSAFHEALGMPVDQFYERFEAYREGLAAQRPGIAGRVMGPGGEGQPEVRVEAIPQGAGRAWRMNTDDAGTFSGTALEGTYRLSLFLGDTSCHLGWFGGPEGYTASRSTVTVLDIPEDARSDIVITLPQPAPEMCRTISGTLSDGEGNPYKEPPWVVAWPVHDQDGYTGKDADALGVFALDVRAGGTFALSLHSYYARECAVSDHPSLVAEHLGPKAYIAVREEDVTGIVVTVGTGPRRAKQFVDCTVTQ